MNLLKFFITTALLTSSGYSQALFISKDFKINPVENEALNVDDC